jgi:Mg2+/Co2+ transporter CorB
MEKISLDWQFAALVLLLVMSGFFSIAETSMMALNRYRLKHLVAQGHRGARRASALLGRTDRLLGAILIGNNLVNAAAATLAGLISVRLLGDDEIAYAASTLVISFLIIVFSEITPKVIGATYPEVIGLKLAYVLGPMQRLFQPGVWFVNLFVRPLLLLVGIRPGESTELEKLTPEEIRTLVLESSTFMPKKHISILLNLFDLGSINVQDVMVPRSRIESIRLDGEIGDIRHQLATSYHMRIPVFRDGRGEVAGVLHLRRVLAPLLAGELDREAISEVISEPYFVPASTPLFAQLQYFQERRERLALVVDEYGELMGLVTLEDIIEEIIGKFTTTLPSDSRRLHWSDDGSAVADGATPVREVNRALGLDLPTDGPKTLNGLVLEHLQAIPEGTVSVRIADVQVEVMHGQGRTIRTLKLFRPASVPSEVPVSA